MYGSRDNNDGQRNPELDKPSGPAAEPTLSPRPMMLRRWSGRNSTGLGTLFVAAGRETSSEPDDTDTNGEV
jgi:hypothetical protein